MKNPSLHMENKLDSFNTKPKTLEGELKDK